MLEQAINLHRAGRLDEAEQAYRQLLSEQPDDAGVLHLLGILRGQRGDLADALRLLSRSSELDPDNAPCQLMLGEIHLSERRFDEAARAYEQARVLNPNLAAAHAGLGHVALLRGDVDAAESHFKVALRADENDTAALTGLGNVALARGDSARALQWLAQAAKNAPDDPLVQASYARALLDEGLLDFAARSLDNALTVKPDYPLVRVLRAEVHVRKGEHAAALPILESLLARGEQVAATRTALGDIARARGGYDEAIAQYDEALRLQPDLHHAAIRRADALAQGGRIAQATDDLRGHVARHPGSIKAHIALAQLLTQTGHYDEAIAVWGAAEARWPGDVNVKAQHALTLDRAGRTDEAHAQAERAAASPRPSIAMLRARGALLAGDPAGAVQRLQRIDETQFDGKPPSLRRRHHRLLGLAYDRLEQWSDAVGEFLHAQPPARRALPELASLDDATRASISERASAPVPNGDATVRAPVFLCGLPGSGVEQVAAWLSARAGVVVRRDRFDAAPDFIDGEFDPRLAQALDTPLLAMLARRYRRSLERLNVADGVQVVDWLPALDARLLPAIRHALPGARVLHVGRDPHDALLNWLAFGWVRGTPVGEPLVAARWLRLAHLHLELATSLLPSLSIEAGNLAAAAGASLRAQVAEFVGFPVPTDAAAAQAAPHGLDGLPIHFEPGHARHYREALPDAFTALDGLAQR